MGESDSAEEKGIVLRGSAWGGIANGVLQEVVDMNPAKLRVAIEERVSRLIAAEKIGGTQ
jgi:hypothetical protein